MPFYHVGRSPQWEASSEQRLASPERKGCQLVACFLPQHSHISPSLESVETQLQLSHSLCPFHSLP